MMKCHGCGAILHSDRPQVPGYVPEQVLLRGDAAICQRCYKIRHYGQDPLGPVQEQTASEAVMNALSWADAVLMVVDLFDFEASLSWDLIRSCRNKPLLALVNKTDLLPRQISAPEASGWVQRRFQALGVPAKPLLVSGLSGAGMDDLEQYLETLPHRRWLVAGAANTGKSTIINGLLRQAGSGHSATVSRFPGTTQQTISWQHPRLGQFWDSPGLVPPGRFVDLVNQEQAVHFVPSRRLRAKVYPFGPGRVLAVPGCTAVECVEAENTTVIVGFSAGDLLWQRINREAIDRWLTEREPAFLAPEDLHRVPVHLLPGQEIAVHGLASVAVRRSPCRVLLHKPKIVKYSVRPHLIGGREY